MINKEENANMGVEVSKISLSVEINGTAYFVMLPHERLKLILSLAESLSDNGKLPVKKAPAGYKFVTLEGLQSNDHN